MPNQKRRVHKALSSGCSRVWHLYRFVSESAWPVASCSLPVSSWSYQYSVACLYMRVCMFLTDLVELMMMQNAQMHQVIMNNMTISALSSFGYTQAHEVLKFLIFFRKLCMQNLCCLIYLCFTLKQHSGPSVTAEVDPEVWHHHHPFSPCVSYPAWVPISLAPMQSNVPLQTIPGFQEMVYPLQTLHMEHRDR